MLRVDQVQECKKLFGQGMSIRQIAVQVSRSRNTVRRYVRGKAVPGVYQLKKPKAQPVIDSVAPQVKAMLAAEKEACVPRKQRLTAARIHRILRDQHGFLGCDSSVRRLVRRLRGEMRDPLSKAFVPLKYEPGVDAQVDFYESVAEYEIGKPEKVFTLLVRPSFSGRTFVYIAPNQTQDALLEGLARAFEFFGGVFPKMWFDNLTPAVRKVLQGRNRVLQEAFAAFMAHYGFEAEFCQPARGNEKGGVENNVKFSRSELFTPVPKGLSRGDIQTKAEIFMTRELQRTMRGRDRTIGELWALESPNLIPLPATRFTIGQVKSCKVSKFCWIAYGTNHYSVPARFAGQELRARFDAEKVTVMDRDGIVATHARLYGKGKMALKIEHYIPILERKLRAVDRALPVKMWLSKQTPCWQLLLHELRRREGEVKGSKDFVAAIKMCSTHGTEVMTKAVRKAVGHPIISLPLLRLELDRLIESDTPRIAPIKYGGPPIREVSASAYDSMLEVHRG